MTQADVPESHRWGSLGDVPDPPEGDGEPLFSVDKGDGVPLYSVDNSGSLPLNGRRPSSYGFTSGFPVYFSCLSFCLCGCSYCLC